MADKAVLFGVNKYKSVSHLRGCVNDVNNVAKLLKSVFDFKSDNVRTRTDDKVTKKEIRKQWSWLLDGAVPGDRLVFHLSGHGSYTADKDGDETEDGVDELLCLYDMDWDDEETYLLDDDLRKMTKDIPDGVHVTFIFDTCHSGTATRALRLPGQPADGDESRQPVVDVKSTVTRAARANRHFAEMSTPAVTIERAIAPESEADAMHTVLARFVPPPPHVLRRLNRVGVRKRVLGMRGAEKMNHVLLAGSRSDQTSADAYISNDFNGAFTYYLCEAVRQVGRQVDHQDVIQRVRKMLVDEDFEQIPQLEPESTRGPLFSAGDTEPVPDKSGTSLPIKDDGKLMQLLERVVTLLESRSADLILGRDMRGVMHLVYVHGICRHEPGYSEPWWQALKPRLSATTQGVLETNRHEVLWSDIVSPARDRHRRVVQPAEEQKLADSLRAVLEDRVERQALATAAQQGRSGRPVASRLAYDRALFGIPGLDCVDDFAKYLLNDSIRDEVLDRFLEVVRPLLESGARVVVISHSWGAVVAYEALREMDGLNLPGRVSVFFTVGSALSIGPVRQGLRTSDGLRPNHVGNWINLDARGDVVGGALQPHFGVDSEYLQLDPVGCESLLGIVSPACAHGSYFRSENKAVNAGVFAHHMEH